jgi:hypothetical protein
MDNICGKINKELNDRYILTKFDDYLNKKESHILIIDDFKLIITKNNKTNKLYLLKNNIELCYYTPYKLGIDRLKIDNSNIYDKIIFNIQQLNI